MVGRSATATRVNALADRLVGYTGGHYWTTTEQGDDPSSEWMYKLQDPVKNLAMDIHEYLDVDFRYAHNHRL